MRVMHVREMRGGGAERVKERRRRMFRLKEIAGDGVGDRDAPASPTPRLLRRALELTAGAIGVREELESERPYGPRNVEAREMPETPRLATSRHRELTEYHQQYIQTSTTAVWGERRPIPTTFHPTKSRKIHAERSSRRAADAAVADGGIVLQREFSPSPSPGRANSCSCNPLQRGGPPSLFQGPPPHARSSGWRALQAPISALPCSSSELRSRDVQSRTPTSIPRSLLSRVRICDNHAPFQETSFPSGVADVPVQHPHQSRTSG